MAVNAMAELVVDLLSATGLVPEDKLAMVRGRAGQGSLAQAIVDEGVAPPEGIARSLAVRYQVALVDLALTGVDKDAAEQIPLHVLERVAAIPYALENGTLRVAVADPGNLHGIDELRLATRYPLDLGVASSEDILAELRRMAARLRGVRRPRRPERGRRGAADHGGRGGGGRSRGRGRRLRRAARPARQLRHLPGGRGRRLRRPLRAAGGSLAVRFRVDGVLQEVQRIPKRMTPGVTTRLKVLAKLDIAERRKPQDGRISLNAAAAGGCSTSAWRPCRRSREKVVMRLLDKSRRAPTLEELGLSDDMRARLAEIIARPTGALLVTGPTGSGKSTTLYAGLTTINRPEINIITVEDPVEYRLAGVNQVQINNRAGLTFASALRSILRSDPDVVMVRDPRRRDRQDLDRGRAHGSLRPLDAAHERRPSAITRLNEMGVEPFLTGAAVTGVLAQRLARKLCTHCCEMYQPSVDELLQSRVAPDVALASDGMAFYRKRGCPRCNQTGYKGRVGVYQLLTMNETIAQLAVARASREEVERAAMEAGCARSGTTASRRSPPA